MVISSPGRTAGAPKPVITGRCSITSIYIVLDGPPIGVVATTSWSVPRAASAGNITRTTVSPERTVATGMSPTVKVAFAKFVP